MEEKREALRANEEKPKELRCSRCLQRLTQLEISPIAAVWWCISCQQQYGKVEPASK